VASVVAAGFQVSLSRLPSGSTGLVCWNLLGCWTADGELYRSLTIEFCLMLHDQDNPKNRGYDQDQQAEQEVWIGW
jgi:hypothetical protein